MSLGLLVHLYCENSKNSESDYQFTQNQPNIFFRQICGKKTSLKIKRWTIRFILALHLHVHVTPETEIGGTSWYFDWSGEFEVCFLSFEYPTGDPTLVQDEHNVMTQFCHLWILIK